MARSYCPRCGAKVPVEDGRCFFGHEVPDAGQPASGSAPEHGGDGDDIDLSALEHAIAALQSDRGTGETAPGPPADDRADAPAVEPAPGAEPAEAARPPQAAEPVGRGLDEDLFGGFEDGAPDPDPVPGDEAAPVRDDAAAPDDEAPVRGDEAGPVPDDEGVPHGGGRAAADPAQAVERSAAALEAELANVLAAIERAEHDLDDRLQRPAAESTGSERDEETVDGGVVGDEAPAPAEPTAGGPEPARADLAEEDRPDHERADLGGQEIPAGHAGVDARWTQREKGPGGEPGAPAVGDTTEGDREDDPDVAPVGPGVDDTDEVPLLAAEEPPPPDEPVDTGAPGPLELDQEQPVSAALDAWLEAFGGAEGDTTGEERGPEPEPVVAPSTATEPAAALGSDERAAPRSPPDPEAEGTDEIGAEGETTHAAEEHGEPGQPGESGVRDETAEPEPPEEPEEPAARPVPGPTQDEAADLDTTDFTARPKRSRGLLKRIFS